MLVPSKSVQSLQRSNRVETNRQIDKNVKNFFCTTGKKGGLFFSSVFFSSDFFVTPYSLNGLLYLYMRGVKSKRFVLVVRQTLGTPNLKKKTKIKIFGAKNL